MKRSITILSVVLLTFHTFDTMAQYGYSSASYSLMKQRSKSYSFPSPEEVVVEELLNYHRHKIAQPTNGQSVGLDLRWGNDTFNGSLSEAVLQIGVATNSITNTAEIPALNVALVIDKSGSMGGDRIEKARQAGQTFVRYLRNVDLLSIVAFDHQTNVLRPSQYVLNKESANGVIRSIEAGGSTDLNAGLIKGYEQVAANYDEKKTNRIILLTDGLTNTGEVDLEQIVQNAGSYSKGHQISITVIAIGNDFNNTLTRQITKSGKHSIHFLHDEDDLNKVFVKEVESLLSPVATHVALRISVNDLEVTDFPGYSPEIQGQDIHLDLNNMNAGLTQVMLCKVAPKENKNAYSVTVTLTYWDILKQKNITQQTSVKLQRKKNFGAEETMLKDNEVKKNYMIATMAQSLKDMAIFASHDNMAAAENVIKTSLKEVSAVFHGGEDQDVKNVRSMLERYVPFFEMAER